MSDRPTTLTSFDNSTTTTAARRMLPRRFVRTLARYARVADAIPATTDLKDEAAYHKACKNALDHAATVLKLLRELTPRDGDQRRGVNHDDDVVRALVEEARAAARCERDEDEDTTDGG